MTPPRKSNPNPGLRPPTDIERAFILAECYVGIAPASWWHVNGRLAVDEAMKVVTLVGEWQPRVGRYRPDFLWLPGSYPLPRYNLTITIPQPTVVELDGHRWHTTEAALKKDAGKDERLVALGYLVVRLWGHLPTGEGAGKIDVKRDPLGAVWAAIRAVEVPTPNAV